MAFERKQLHPIVGYSIACFPIASFLFYFFLSVFLIPTISPAKAGLSWQECEVKSYFNTELEEIQDCISVPAPESAIEDVLKASDVWTFPLTSVYHPFRLNGQTIYVGRMGYWYFVSYNGRRLGPVFSDVYTHGCCEYGVYAIHSGKGMYTFRGKREGKVYLVLIRVEKP